MTVPYRLIVCFLFSGLANIVFASDQSPPEKWDKNNAIAAVYSVDIGATVNALNDPALLNNSAAVLAALVELESRNSWPLPAREAAILQFTKGLSAYSRDDISTALVEHLIKYQARVLVAHEDHVDMTVPMFNIRAAATGVKNGWLRSESAVEASIVLDSNPEVFVRKYLKSTRSIERAGMLDALKQVRTDSVVIVQDEALAQLATSPGLTMLVAASAAITADPVAIQRLLKDGSGTGLSQSFTLLASTQTPAEATGILNYAIENGTAENAAIAIAAWWPLAQKDASGRKLMTDLLADKDLGSSAALALAQQPDIQTIYQLQQLASGDDLTARRAQLALTINRDLIAREVQP